MFFWESHSGRKQILLIGLFIILFLVETDTTLILPSVPGWTSVIRPRSHCPGPHLSSAISTRSPISAFLVPCNHFGRDCSRLRYSLRQRFQKCCFIRSNLFHRSKWFSLMSSRVSCWIQFVGSPIKSGLESGLHDPMDQMTKGTKVASLNSFQFGKVKWKVPQN